MIRYGDEVMSTAASFHGSRGLEFWGPSEVRMKLNLKKAMIVAGLVTVGAVAHADAVATGTVTRVNTGAGDIAIYINAQSGSACGSGWFYSYTSDSDDATIARLYATILLAWTNGTAITIYDATVTCSGGRFTSMSTN